MGRICCPDCGREEAYEVGPDRYECPLCGFEWEVGLDDDDFEVIVWSNRDRGDDDY